MHWSNARRVCKRASVYALYTFACMYYICYLYVDFAITSHQFRFGAGEMDVIPFALCITNTWHGYTLCCVFHVYVLTHETH